MTSILLCRNAKEGGGEKKEGKKEGRKKGMTLFRFSLFKLCGWPNMEKGKLFCFVCPFEGEKRGGGKKRKINRNFSILGS